MDDKKETINLLIEAVLLSKQGEPSAKKVAKLGEGWVAEEALAIAVYCALSYPEDFEKSLQLSVNHNGDSDSTGSICGNIMGAKLGLSSIPKKWIENLELSNLIKEMAEKLYDCKCYNN
jgi:ADP-ribosylglycohydrolase